jgi:hypothetical protein
MHNAHTVYTIMSTFSSSILAFYDYKRTYGAHSESLYHAQRLFLHSIIGRHSPPTDYPHHPLIVFALLPTILEANQQISTALATRQHATNQPRALNSVCPCNPPIFVHQAVPIIPKKMTPHTEIMGGPRKQKQLPLLWIEHSTSRIRISYTMTRSELQSGALPGELKRLHIHITDKSFIYSKY